MKLKFFCLSVILAVALSGCGSNKPKETSAGTSKLDVLTDFSVAINENNFMKAINFLVEEDRVQLLSGGSVTNMAQKQLKALRLQKLIKDRRIGLREGKLTGIVMVMPKLEHITRGGSEPDQLPALPPEQAPEASESPEPTPSEEPASETESLPEVPASSPDESEIPLEEPSE